MKLADPYTEEEIIKFENENNLKLPINLRSTYFKRNSYVLSTHN